MKRKYIKITSLIIIAMILFASIIGIWYVTYGATTTYVVGENAEATFNSITGELTVRSTSGVGKISIRSADSWANLDYHIGKENVKTITFVNKLHPLNILSISVALDVSKLLKSILVNDLHPLNIELISVILDVST